MGLGPGFRLAGTAPVRGLCERDGLRLFRRVGRLQVERVHGTARPAVPGDAVRVPRGLQPQQRRLDRRVLRREDRFAGQDQHGRAVLRLVLEQRGRPDKRGRPDVADGATGGRRVPGRRDTVAPDPRGPPVGRPVPADVPRAVQDAVRLERGDQGVFGLRGPTVVGLQSELRGREERRRPDDLGRGHGRRQPHPLERPTPGGDRVVRKIRFVLRVLRRIVDLSSDRV